VPRLDESGTAEPVRVHDTSTQALAVSDPDGAARMYVCGITPYDATHLGHAATYIAFDLLNRAWRDAGHDVRYVQNVTDVDDPLLERAVATGVDWAELAERETDLFREDMTALRVLAPDAYVGAVEAIPRIVELVQRLQERGVTYDVDGDVYFAVRSDPRFGSVSGLDEATMTAVFAERGGDPGRHGKKDPLDCLLWQAERPGEPAWDSPLGRGRPGWHVECAAIALEHLGEGFDVEGGGSDLAFPHHEMSASEAQAAHEGSTFARAYVHAGMVGYEGEKMSKSKGNLVLVSTLRHDGHDPMAIRLALLAHHYRSDWEWTDDDLTAAEARLAAWRASLPSVSRDRAEQLVRDVRAALATDLDAPAALAAVDAVAAEEPGDGSGADLVRRLLDARLGVLL
jgi:L-cysteine:1D-myo-inositol 2-amino-2-deoxy-alpha-D-glucopyranoside ligase